MKYFAISALVIFIVSMALRFCSRTIHHIFDKRDITISNSYESTIKEIKLSNFNNFLLENNRYALINECSKCKLQIEKQMLFSQTNLTNSKLLRGVVIRDLINDGYLRIIVDNSEKTIKVKNECNVFIYCKVLPDNVFEGKVVKVEQRNKEIELLDIDIDIFEHSDMVLRAGMYVTLDIAHNIKP